MSGQRKVLHFTESNSLREEIEVEKIKKNRTKEDNNFTAMLSLVSGLGLSIALPIAMGAFAGNILDNKFHSSPGMTLSLIFLGLFIGVANIYTSLKKIKED